MTDDSTEIQVRRAYAKGYDAGRRKKIADTKARTRAQAEQEFWDQAFLQLLPECFRADNWTDRKSQPIRSLTQRVALAAEGADIALRKRRERE